MATVLMSMMTITSTMNENNNVDTTLRYQTMMAMMMAMMIKMVMVTILITDLRYQTLMDDAEEVDEYVDVDDKDDIDDDWE